MKANRRPIAFICLTSLSACLIVESSRPWHAQVQPLSSRCSSAATAAEDGRAINGNGTLDDSQCTPDEQQQSSVDVHRQTGFVRADQMIKLTLTPPDSSNRLELNHFQPLSRWEQSILFFDNTVYGKTRPFQSSDDDLPFIETYGESFRLGYRQLIKNTTAFFGINGGYDASFQQGYYFQQVGIGFEGIFPNLAIQATLTQGLGLTYYEQLGQSLLSSFNIQAGFPIGIPSLSMATRFYYINNQLGQSAPGGQLQLVYGINRHLSANISASYDDVGGFGSSLQFRYLFNPPKPSKVPASLSYGIASSFSSAIGNTGSRIIRLTGSVPAMGD